MKSLAQARLKRTQAVELIARGMSYDQVASAVGYSHRGSAHRAVFQALDEREVEGVDQFRAIELARLDRLLPAVWDRALTGDIRAVNAASHIIVQQARLMGLGGRAGLGGSDARPQVLVVGPAEGNPREATGDTWLGEQLPEMQSSR